MDARPRPSVPVFPLVFAALLLAVWVTGTRSEACPSHEAAPAPMPVLDQPEICGYYEGGRRWAYYGNCTDKWVLVTVDAAQFPDRAFLMPPGETYNLLHASAARGVYDVQSC